MAEALSQVVFATSFSETQPELSGVLFSFQEKELRLAATDRYRLAERRLSISSENPVECKVIIPNRAVSELVRMIGEETGQIEISIAESQVLFRASSSELISRLIEGQYPDYQQIIPKDFMTTVTVKIEEFVSAIKLSGLFVSSENNNIEMRADKEKNLLILKSISQRFGSNKTEIPCVVQGQDNEMIFNFRYLLDCLNHVSSPKVQLKLINSNSPAMIMAEGQENYLYLVMPIKT
ncbi:MAG: DNA polymerase III subunit beta [bacterium]|nr:DNA polymerase III subunit beta [bacterium]